LLHAHGLTLFEPAEVTDADLRRIAAWAVEFLNAPHEQLGRRGPVCPFTALSMSRNAFLLADAGPARDAAAIEALVHRYRGWFAELDEPLLTILLVLPGLDRIDPGPLDTLQARLKDAFVGEGLMIGQFHPRCDQPGLWSEDFRPLRAPVPLLAIRRMVASDLPFLLGTPGHLTAYLDRFAPDIPAHVRRLLVARATGTTVAA
jgi:hypothetical protein